MTIAPIAVITDQHFGARNDNQAILDNQEKFYKEIFFPTIDKHNVKIVFDLGDTFDRRKGIDFRTLDKVRKFYFNELRKRDIQLISIVGNHTTYYRDSNSVNSLELILQEYDNIKVIAHKPEELEIKGKKFLFAPWINSENYSTSMDIIKNSRADILCAHLEIEGFQMQRGNICKHGMNKSLFSHFNRVWSGHFHSPSIQNNIHYLGSPTETSWSDYGDEKGFYLYNIEDDHMMFIENNIGLHKKIVYNGTNSVLENVDLKDSIVRVIVESNEDPADYKKFMEQLFKNAPSDVKISEEIRKVNTEGVKELSIDDLKQASISDLIMMEIQKRDLPKSKEIFDFMNVLVKEAEELT